MAPSPLQLAAALPREFVPISNLFTLLYQDSEVSKLKALNLVSMHPK